MLNNIKEYLGLEAPFRLYDENGNKIYYENYYGYWSKYKYDENCNEIYYDDSLGCWNKREYDENGSVIYVEDSDGVIIDKRPKQSKDLTVSEISELLGYDVRIVKGDE